MKTGKTITELAQQLTDQQESKRDFMAEASEIRFVDKAQDYGHSTEDWKGDNQIAIDGLDDLTFEVSDNCHRQVASRLNIPWKYYDRMSRETPELLRENVNHWLEDSSDRRMVRTLDGTARAFLSDRYRRLDNLDMAEAVLPALSEVPDMEIVSSELTEDRMYIKALFPRIEAEITKGDVVQSGLVISNSEVGKGAVKVEQLVYRLVCTNGMISRDHSTRRNHIGRNAESESYELFTDETLKQDDKAFWMKVQDTVRGFSTNAEHFLRVVEKMREATGEPIYGEPIKAVETLANTLSLTDGEQSGVLTYLLQGNDLTKYGMANAVTRTAQDVASYDRSTDLEALGSTVIDLTASQWKQVAEATS